MRPDATMPFISRRARAVTSMKLVLNCLSDTLSSLLAAQEPPMRVCATILTGRDIWAEMCEVANSCNAIWVGS